MGQWACSGQKGGDEGTVNSCNDEFSLGTEASFVSSVICVNFLLYTACVWGCVVYVSFPFYGFMLYIPIPFYAFLSITALINNYPFCFPLKFELVVLSNHYIHVN